MNFELFFFTFSYILTSHNLSATVKKQTCFMFSYCINYSRNLTLKQQKNLHKGLYIQMKGRSKNKSLQFSHLVNVTCFCIYVEKNIFYFIFKRHEKPHQFLRKRNFYCHTLNQFRPLLCYSQSQHFTWLFQLSRFN